jgi:quinol monooxygenase YgiN
MPRAKPVMMLCTYRPKKGKERAFRALLLRHVPTLLEAGLAAEVEPGLFRGTDRRGRTVFIETFAWRSDRAADLAHRTPEVMALWGPMEELADEMDFIEVEPLAAPSASRSRPPRRRSSARARRA